MSSYPKLPLTAAEKATLKKEKVKRCDIHSFRPDQLANLLHIPVERAKTLKGLAEFQTVPSIGPKLAEKLLYQLNIFSLYEIKDKNGAELFDELEQHLGVWTDACVEDQLRCVIHYANHPNSQKQWFDFTEQRKKERDITGYPTNRPQTAWYK
ncbi:helix-hairpin-helix domain-containing protein [Halalkalibacter oceani]|uniref:Helix-hairpin-helix domain-containing protein n=1 Tax=Halalkalibacter oceani TaxID=1653776 RepID=A0A9X2IMW0_9BACI|nr:helix-hairpin-helix domain-containing protein [Halalkalibacter oceani]MCM3713420.1 helix-hairpin-helix domain-containing protein [Halalkalibacter oceani]